MYACMYVGIHAKVGMNLPLQNCLILYFQKSRIMLFPESQNAVTAVIQLFSLWNYNVVMGSIITIMEFHFSIIAIGFLFIKVKHF